MSKNVNRIQRQEIEKLLKQFRSGVTVDEIQINILAAMNLAGLDNKTIAALLFSIMRNILSSEKNTNVFETMGIDNKDLSISQVLQLQELLINEYLRSAQV